MNTTQKILSMLVLTVLLGISSNAHLLAQVVNIPVTFRLVDSAKTYVRAFVAGDFNNFGPSSGMRILAGAPSEMQYDSIARAWTKTILLQRGTAYKYIFHIHKNADGTDYDWIADPLNPPTEGLGTGNRTSTIVVTSLAFAQMRLDSAQGMVRGVSGRLDGSGTITQLLLLIERNTSLNAPFDTISLMRNLNGQTRTFQATLPQAIPTNRTVRLFVRDADGNSSTFRFMQIQPSVPEWAKTAVWYQIFPERFRNGDTSNDPTRASLEAGNGVSDKWRTTEWGSDWFARDEWEKEFGSGVGGFYTNALQQRRYGGDLQGVLDRLDYLQSLGITAIYFNPIFFAASMHKYDGYAHHHIDPYFGPNPKADLEQIARENASADPYNPKTWAWTSADSLFLKVLREAKRRNIRIILDGVFNHTGRGTAAYQDLVKNQAASRFKDWYIVQAFDNPATPENEFRTKGWSGFAGLPEIARSPDGATLADAPKQYFFDVAKRWMDPNNDGNPADGIDGWRLDVVPDAPIGFWNEWNIVIRRINPEAYTSAEIWDANTPSVVQNGNFSGAMNYWTFMQPVIGYFTLDHNITPDMFNSMVESRWRMFPPSVQAAMQNLVESHDTERISSFILNPNTQQQFSFTRNAWGNRAYDVRRPRGDEREKHKLISMYQMASKGAPMLYYGTESGIWGGHDPDDRSPMNWADIRFAPQALSPSLMRTEDDMNFDSTLFRHYQAIIRARNSTASWVSQIKGAGQLMVIQRTGSTNAQVSVIDSLPTASKRFQITVLNRTKDTVTQTITDSQFANAAAFAPLYYTRGSAASVRFRNESRGFTITLPPFSGAIIAGNNQALVSVRQSTESVQAKAYPQPFTSETTLQYTLPSASTVSIKVIDVLGRELWSRDAGTMPAGAYDISLSGDGLPQGTYFCLVSTQFGVERVRLLKQ